MDPNKEDIYDVVLDNEREIHWCMVFEGGNGGVDGKNTLLHAKKWDVYNSEKESLLKGEYLVEVYDKEGKKVILEVVGDHLVEEGVKH